MLSRRVAGLDAPWIDQLKSRADALAAGGADVISLGQAVPGFPPPTSALRAARAALDSPAAHVYTADAGTIELRTAVAAWLNDVGGGAAGPENLLITVGANQAFMLAVLTLLDPDDEVLLASPYFLNHETAVRAASAIPVEVAAVPERAFTLALDELERIAIALGARDVALVIDETYLPFVYDGVPFTGTALTRHTNVVSIGSFSKAFAMTGWRLGYLAGPPGFIEEALKVQDAMVICAPAVSQAAVLGALLEEPRYIERFLPELRRRREFLRERLAGVPGLEWSGAAGGFFAFVRVQNCTDSVALASRILDEAHVVTLPGRLFGRAGEGFLRLSYGAKGTEDIARALDRVLPVL
jgi:aspartate/methionine/tyrosine aminotransferase